MGGEGFRKLKKSLQVGSYLRLLRLPRRLGWVGVLSALRGENPWSQCPRTPATRGSWRVSVGIRGQDQSATLGSLSAEKWDRP